MTRLAQSKLARQIEEQHGKPIRQVLVDAINRYGSVAAAARELGIPANTCYSWAYRLGLEVRKYAISA